jgi:hypothetical protein
MLKLSIEVKDMNNRSSDQGYDQSHFDRRRASSVEGSLCRKECDLKRGEILQSAEVESGRAEDHQLTCYTKRVTFRILMQNILSNAYDRAGYQDLLSTPCKSMTSD